MSPYIRPLLSYLVPLFTFFLRFLSLKRPEISEEISKIGFAARTCCRPRLVTLPRAGPRAAQEHAGGMQETPGRAKMPPERSKSA